MNLKTAENNFNDKNNPDEHDSTAEDILARTIKAFEFIDNCKDLFNSFEKTQDVDELVDEIKIALEEIDG